MRLLAPFLGRLENRIFFPACANCMVAVIDSTTFMHCKWAKVRVQEALTEKRIVNYYYRRNVILTARQFFCPPAMYKGKAKGKFAGELIILTQWVGRHAP